MSRQCPILTPGEWKAAKRGSAGAHVGAAIELCRDLAARALPPRGARPDRLAVPRPAHRLGRPDFRPGLERTHLMGARA